MATEKQIAANRANTAKSTGPRSVKTFVESFYAEYHPSTPTKTALVDTMATARWRLIRMSNHAHPRTLAYSRASDAGRSIEMMNCAETRLQHQFNSTFDRLRLLKAAPK